MLRQPSFKYTVGYVVQDDIYSGTLTVRENIFFSANLRLPETVSKIEKSNRVSSIITELGLESCADTYMGTELSRGVSGGERKRTSIGMELILSPKILFLDEPTTGKYVMSNRNAQILLEYTVKYSILLYLKKLLLFGISEVWFLVS